MSWYFDKSYKPTIETDKGIRARETKGEFVKNWWAERWLAAMEQLMDRGRLQRGRSYARKGQVLSLEEAKGHITARVQGSRKTPYKVSISLTPLSAADWKQVVAAMEERPAFTAQLLAGHMPQDIEEAFSAVRLSLFPGQGELQQSCSCPDYADVCKHLAAVHYILAQRFDEDPFLLFRLRGRTQEQIVAGLTPKTPSPTAAAPSPAAAPATATLPLTEALDDFWRIGPSLDSFPIRIAAPEAPYPLLERLGEPEFVPEARSTLSAAYAMVTAHVLQIAYEDDEAEVNPK